MPELSTDVGEVRRRAQAAVLEPWLVAPVRNRGAKPPLDVLGIGAGVGRWAASLDPGARLAGLDVSEALIKTAPADISERRLGLLSADLLVPYDAGSFDLAFTVTMMHRYPDSARRTLLSEIWRVTGVGGRLLFLDDFVFPEQLKEPGVYPVSVTRFVDLILEATGGQVVLEHVESLRYPGEDLHRGALISLTRLGVART